MLKNNVLKNSAFILIVTLIVIVSGSCKSTKKIQAAISKKDTSSMHTVNKSALDSAIFIRQTVADLQKKKFNYKTFSAKIKVEYEDNKGKQPNITAYVRMLKDSVIWISGYATVFNIEAFRVLITKDSVFLIDKINKEVQLRSMDYLQDVTAIPFDLITLQNLIVGNPIFFEDSVVSYRQTESVIMLSSFGNFFKHLLTINKESRLMVHSKLDDLDINRNRTADITYSDFDFQQGFPFSTNREITVSEKNKLDVYLNFKQYDFNKELSISFSIPKNFKRK